MAPWQNDPAYKTAVRCRQVRFTSSLPCSMNAEHFERFTTNGRCANCSDARNAKQSRERAAARAARPSPPKIPVRTRGPSGLRAWSRRTKKPMIGQDLDVEDTNEKLIEANSKFLALLHHEALTAIRMSHAQE